MKVLSLCLLGILCSSVEASHLRGRGLGLLRPVRGLCRDRSCQSSGYSSPVRVYSPSQNQPRQPVPQNVPDAPRD